MAVSTNRIIFAFLWKLLERCGVQGIGFVMAVVLARLLQPSEYGEIALVLVFVNIANVVVDGGLNTALIQKKDADGLDFSTIFHASVCMALLLYGVIFALAPFIAAFFGNSHMAVLIRVLALSLVFYAVNSLQRAFISRHLLFKQLFKASVVTVVGSGAIGVLLALKGFGVWALVAHHLSSALLVCVVTGVMLRWRPTLHFSFVRFRQLFDYGWKIFVSNLLISLFVNIRGLVIGKLYAPAALAFFDRGKQLPSLIMENLNTSLQTVLFPAFSAEQEHRDKLCAMVSRSIKTSSLLVFPIMVWLFVVAEPLIRLLLTDKWLPAVPFVRIFCLSYMLMPLQTANLEAIKSMGRSDVFLRLELVKKVLEVSILVATACVSVYAIAWGVVAYNSICLFLNLHPRKRLLGYALLKQLCDVWPPLAASLVMGCLIYAFSWLPLPCLPMLLLQTCVGGMTYLLICHFSHMESFRYVLHHVHSILSHTKGFTKSTSKDHQKGSP